MLIISDPQGIERERRELAVRACDASPASQGADRPARGAGPDPVSE